MRTPMFDQHAALGGRMVEFCGWEMPIQYETGIKEEHLAVRKSAGLFDVSHMGEILVTGRKAEAFVQHLVTNDVSRMGDGQVQYNMMCYESGGVVDDLLVYRYGTEKYLLVVNAANVDKDFKWIEENVFGNVVVENISDRYAEVAIQGPQAQEILQRITSEDLSKIEFFHFQDEVHVDGIEAIVSRTGYTGEDGFEIYIPWSSGAQIWRKLLEVGVKDGLKPIGLGARDSLRFEACLPLYGHEISSEITPLEAGLGFFVKLDKEEFNGMDPLRKMKAEGLPRRSVGLEMVDRGVPRDGYCVVCDGVEIGHVTTGGYSPSLDRNIALALVRAEYAVEGRELNVLIRNREKKAKIVKKPFYRKNYKR